MIEFLEPDITLFMFLTAAVLHALTAYSTAFVDWWIVTDCGARLERLLRAGSTVVVPPAPEISSFSLNGLSPREIFGLGYEFTRRELDQARRRLAKSLHPDSRGTNLAGRATAEEAMKQVNAAYDVLRPEAI